MTSPQRHQHGRRGFAAAGAAALAAALAAAGCAPKIEPGEAVATIGEPLPVGAATQTVRRVAVPGRIDVPGTMESEQKVQLSAKIPAHVERVLVSAGQAVRAGEELIRLDDRELREQLAAAEAQLRHAEAEHDRTRGLFDSKAATAQQLVAAETARDAARAQVERTRVMLSFARIASPIDGVVADRRVEEGDLASPGQVLLTVYDPARMRLEAPVPVRLAAALSVGQEVEVLVATPDGRRRARISEIVSEIDAASRTRKVRALLEDPSGLQPGAFGRLTLATEPVDSIRVPERAVSRVGQLELVRVVRDGRVVRRLVRTGPRSDGMVEVLAGLEDGDVLVLPAAEER